MRRALTFHLTAITHLFSMTMGVAFSLNRIGDFDLTAKIARVRESEPKAPRLKSMRSTVRRARNGVLCVVCADAISLRPISRFLMGSGCSLLLWHLSS